MRCPDRAVHTFASPHATALARFVIHEHTSGHYAETVGVQPKSSERVQTFSMGSQKQFPLSRERVGGVGDMDAGPKGKRRR